MHGHDGCGCGHAHGETAVPDETMEAPVQVEGGCGEGCGCGSSGASAQAEVAALRGFLSGIYASRLDRSGLEAYLASMAQQEGSEFQQPALFLTQHLGSIPAEGEEPPAWRLLDAVAGEGDEETLEDDDAATDETPRAQ